jgi:hypothetical protein
MKEPGLGFESIEVGPQTRLGDRIRNFEQEDEVGLQPPGREPQQVLERHEVELAAVALIRQRGRDVAVAHHIATAGQRGLDDLVHVLRFVGRVEQRLRARVEILRRGIENDLPHHQPEIGRAGLEGEQRVDAFGEQARLGRLAGGVTAFEDDEAASCRHA